MLIKTKLPEKTKPEIPLRRTSTQELMVYQVNQPRLVGDGVNRKNKDGILVLGDDGQYLRNIKVAPDGVTVVRHDGPVDVTLEEIIVQGVVTVDNTVTVEPVTVANMPDHIRIQENLHVVQTPLEAKVAPFNFSGCGTVILSRPCRIYGVHLTVCEPTFVEIVGITGEMWTKELKLNLFPQFIQVNRLEIETREYVEAGGYVIYEDC